MSIHVIFTGGTIGSKLKSDGKIGTNEQCRYELLEKYEGREVFTTSAPFSVLSENMDAEHLNRLVSEVRQVLAAGENNRTKTCDGETKLTKSCDGNCTHGEGNEGGGAEERQDQSPLEGIIITHGSDTIAYTASILQYAFCDCGIPICLVCSAYVLDDPRQNGMDHFSAAVALIHSATVGGVYVPYRNVSELSVKIYGGNHLFGHLPFSSDLFGIEDLCMSLQSQPNATLIGVVPQAGRALYGSDHSLLGKSPISLAEDASLSIHWLKTYPGCGYPLGGFTKAVLLDTYHSGTIGDTEGLRKLCTYCKERDIPVFLTGTDDQSEAYESTDMFYDLGICELPRSTPISQYCKLWLLLSAGVRGREALEQYMTIPLAGDRF